MNTSTLSTDTVAPTGRETHTPETNATAPVPSTPEAPKPESSESEFKGRRISKIARLPRETRQKLNLLLLDGVAYPEILARLGPELSGITEMNLSRWRTSGFQDWLKQQDWLDQEVTHLDFADAINTGHQGAQIQQASLHIAATQLMQNLTSSGLRLLEDEPEIYARLINALTRISREALTYEKYREACAQARKELEPMRDPKRELTDEERQAIVDKVDRILGLK